MTRLFNRQKRFQKIVVIMAKQTARRLFNKLPKEGLFLFDCDKKTDLCATKCIIDDRDKIFEGSRVTLKYDGKELLTAKILRLSGIYMSLFAD